MKRYCFDTSGFSNPLESIPEDIYGSIWLRIRTLIEEGRIGVTTEIYDEMVHIQGIVGECIREHRSVLVLEVMDAGWDWQSYVHNARDMQLRYVDFISERQGGRKGTVGITDLSIIALAKTLQLPLVSMESPY